VFTVGGLSILVGALLLTIGLIRRRAVPAWAAIALTVATVVNIAGFTAGSNAVVAASWALLLAAMLPVVRVLSPGRERLAVSVVPSR
jgi:hypothetical protein